MAKVKHRKPHNEKKRKPPPPSPKVPEMGKGENGDHDAGNTQIDSSQTTEETQDMLTGRTWWEIAKLIVAVVTSLGTVAAVIVVYCMSHSANELTGRNIELMDSNFVVENRAYINVVNPRTSINAFGDTLVSIDVTNFGKTPAFSAYDCCMYCRSKIGTPPCDPLSLTRSVPGDCMIAPSESLVIPFSRNQKHWDWDVNCAKQIFGVIYYADYRKNPHKTVFAFQFENKTGMYRRIKGQNYGD